MKSSLVSATSLLALLVFDGGELRAATISLGASSDNFGNVLVNQQSAAPFTDVATYSGGTTAANTLTWGSASGIFSGGGNSSNFGSSSTGSTAASFTFSPTATGVATAKVTVTGTGATSKSLTLTGTGVAPVQQVAVTNSNVLGSGIVTSGNMGNVLVGSSASAIITVTNIGNGDLATGGGSSTVNNLNGSLGNASSSSIFVGTGGSFNIKDSNATGSPVTSQAYTYTFTPTAAGAQTATVIAAFTNGSTGGGNNANNVASTLSGTGVAPVLNISNTVSAGYVLVNQSATAVVTVNNTGNGNLSGQGTISNLNGTVGTAGSGSFSGTGGTVALKDSSSQAYTYVYTPTTRGANSVAVVSAFQNGNTTNTASTQTSTLTGTGVAPVNSVSSANAGYVRIGTTGSATVSVSNVGNGNLSGAGTISNLNGSVSNALGTGFSTSSPNTVSLTDSGSSTLGYTYSPISHASATTTATLSFANGSTVGNNAAQTITASVSAAGVGPTFQSNLGSTVTTPTAMPQGTTATTGPNLSFFVATKATQTLYLNLGNVSTDANGGNSSLTDLTIESFSFAGTNASAFSSTFSTGKVISEGFSYLMPITVSSGALTGLLNSSLTIFTDESVGLGGVGDTFTYQLTALVPEPASLAVLGAGLAGLAFARHRNKAQSAAQRSAESSEDVLAKLHQTR